MSPQRIAPHLPGLDRRTDAAPIRAALDRAHRVLWQSQLPDGSWESPGDMGPMPTSQVVVALHHLRALDPRDAADAAKWLRAQQAHDGSFLLHPFAREGDVGATACAWAALHVAAPVESAESIRRATAWLQTRGGVNRVISDLEKGDLSAMFLLLAGLAPAEKFPAPSMIFTLFQPLMRLLERRFHSGILMVAMQLGVLVRKLRGDWGVDGKDKGLLAEAECRRAIDLLQTFQNQDGSWNANTLQGALAIPTLRAAGLGADDPRIQKGIDWLLGQRVRDERGLRFHAFGSAVWSTAFDVRALLASGVEPRDPDLQRALSWLVDSQLDVPQPEVDNRNPGAPRTGGWAFQRGNHTMADSDDAGVVLTALGMALASTDERGVDADLERRIRASVTRGREWLFGMQNPDGGWSAFVWGLPGKKPGPMFQQTPRMKLDDVPGMVLKVVFPPPELGDPSTEDVTARVLHGLGNIGLTVSSPEVRKAVDFLRAQQCPDGSWWGRWVVNYLSATAFVVLGLEAVKVDLGEEWIRHAIRWMLSKQNPDGGWGEGPDSYSDPTRAGQGHSMAPLTGLVLQALIVAGEAGHPAVARGIDYLLSRQRPDGTWPNEEFLHTNVPPDTYYLLAEAARYYPTEALARYLAVGDGPRRSEHAPRWTETILDLMRQETDPVADSVVEEIYREGSLEAVNRMMASIFRTDAPVPEGIPEIARVYFEQSAALPAWADRAKIAVAQKLFTRAGWEVAAGLFCSSLPQAYACAKGAHVLTQTQGMTRHVRQRIFETAQFLFDVLDEGALEPEGRGIRAAQKVRLMHAGIRHLIRVRPDPAWDGARLGLPVNQEDLVGTLMTFSALTLDALERLEVEVSDDEADAWIHTWNVVGSLLGVREALMPGDRAEAEALMDAIRDRHWAPSADGRQLIQPLVQLMQDYFPGRPFDGLPVAMIRNLSGDHCAELLGLPPTDWTRVLLDAALKLESLFAGKDRRQQHLHLISHATHLLMEGIVLAEREGKQARFRIPPSLRRTVSPRL